MFLILHFTSIILSLTFLYCFRICVDFNNLARSAGTKTHELVWCG